MPTWQQKKIGQDLVAASQQLAQAKRLGTVGGPLAKSLAAGYSEHEISGILAQQKGLSDKTVREILREQVVLKKRK